METAIGIKNLCLSLKGKDILRGINLAIPARKRSAIIGPNGAGKSTLLSVMAALNTSFRGEVYLGGEDIRRLSRRKIAQIIGLLPQNLAAPAGIRVEQLVDYGRFPHRSLFSRNAKADRQAVDAAMRSAKVEKLASRQVETLSGGERQRVFLAMALAQSPKILLLDEPTTYLDIAHQLEVMEIVTALNKKQGLTVVMVLHDINHALQYADELLVIKEGRLMAQGDPAAIMTTEFIAKVFGVKTDKFLNSQGKMVLSPVGRE